jgi:hypothetical protein
MRKMLVAVALAALPLTIPPATPAARLSDLLAAPAPPEPVCIVIMGKRICW